MLRPRTKWFTLNNFVRFCLLFFLLQPALKAQSAYDKAMKVQELYQSLKFEKAVQYSRQLLRSDTPFTKEQLILIHQFTAYAFFNLAQTDSARKHFVDILIMDPQYQLDPVTTSPKIIRFFNDLKKELKQKKLNFKIAYTRYVFVPDPRPGAAWRSALLPGWGQYFKGQKKKALGLASAFAASGTFTLVAAILEKNYHRKYLDTRQPDALAKNYDLYNRWYKIRKRSLYVMGIIWVASFADALWAPWPAQAPLVGVQINKRNEAQLVFNFVF